MDEKLQRGLTLKQLVIRSLQIYCSVPESAHRQFDEAVKSSGVGQQELVREFLPEVLRVLRGKRPKRKSQQTPEEIEREKLVSAIQALLHLFPLEKLQLLKDLCRMDAVHYRSSRIKPTDHSCDELQSNATVN